MKISRVIMLAAAFMVAPGLPSAQAKGFRHLTPIQIAMATENATTTYGFSLESWIPINHAPVDSAKCDPAPSGPDGQTLCVVVDKELNAVVMSCSTRGYFRCISDGDVNDVRPYHIVMTP